MTSELLFCYTRSDLLSQWIDADLAYKEKEARASWALGMRHAGWLWDSKGIYSYRLIYRYP